MGRTIRGFVVLALLAGALQVATRAQAATCTVPGSHSTIAAATSDPICTTIKIGAGVYYENVEVSKPGTKIIGAGGGCEDKKQTVIDGSPGGINATATHVQADDVTITGVVLRHGTAGVHVDADRFTAKGICAFGHRGEDNYSAGVLVFGDDAKVLSSEFHSMDGPGVRLENGEGALVKRNDVHNAGWHCVMSKMKDTVVDSNTLSSCDDHGVKTERRPPGAVIKNNVISSINRGVELRSEGALVTGNTIGNANDYGIQLEKSDNSVVSGNVISEAREDCIELLDSGGSRVSDNRLGSCGGDAAIQVRDESGYVVTGNIIRYARERCLYAEDTDDVQLTGNSGTQCGGVQAEGSNPIVRNNAFQRVSDRNGFEVSCDGSCNTAEIVGNFVGAGTRDHHGFSIYGDGTGPALVQDNVSVGSGGHGFRFEALHGTTVTGNRAAGSGQREGSNDRVGFNFDDTSGATVTGNIAIEGRDDGFRLNSGSSNTFTKNKAIKNAKDGFHITTTDSPNIFEGNIAKKNGAEGFEDDGSGTQFTNNVAKKNRWDCNFKDGSGTYTGNTCADGHNPLIAPPQGEID